MSKDSVIQDFWEWFSTTCGEFGDKFENEDLIRELDDRIGRIGPISWEIGPGFENEAASSLVFSPAGDKSILSRTREIVANAPQCKGWEFYSSKPPKKWQRRFVVTDETANEYEVDGADWSYVLLRYPDRTIDIMIEAPEIRAIPSELHDTVGEILVDGEIGESRRIETIENIECVQEFDDEYKTKSKPIALLAGHLEHVLSGS